MGIKDLRKKLNDRVQLNSDLVNELKFWSRIEEHKTMPIMKQNLVTQTIEAFSDASMKN